MYEVIPNSIEEAATATVALINSNPRSPRQAEIDAIIRGLVYGAGATGPLLTGYASNEEEMATWDEMRRRATKLAARYPLQPGACGKDGEEQASS